MRRYIIHPAKEPLPELRGYQFDPEQEPFCESADIADIDCYLWDVTHYTPEAHACVTWSAEGLHVLLYAREKEITVRCREFGGEVYMDSCLEFFLQPFMDDPRYINIEVNAGGFALIGFGAGRAERIRLEEEPEGMDIRASRHRGGWWAVAYTVPAALLRELYGRTPMPGDVMRGNFYKCEEHTNAHFGTWHPVINFQPDFHRPECFGEMELSKS